jgi:hypothetical protein
MTTKIILFTPGQALAFETDDYKIEENGDLVFVNTSDKGKFRDTYRGTFLIEKQLHSLLQPTLEVLKP